METRGNTLSAVLDNSNPRGSQIATVGKPYRLYPAELQVFPYAIVINHVARALLKPKRLGLPSCLETSGWE